MSKIFMFVFFAFFVLSSQVFALGKSNKPESQEEIDRVIVATLIEMANQINQQTPMMLDSETQVSSVLALGKSINFSVKFINVSSKDIDAEQVDNYSLEQLNDTVCKNQATRTLIDLGVSYIYLYYGNDDRLITRVAIEKYKCN